MKLRRRDMVVVFGSGDVDPNTLGMVVKARDRQDPLRRSLVLCDDGVLWHIPGANLYRIIRAR